MSSSKPMTVGELQLYKVLQRANLLSYYESFISQGGDDVQQLCEAGEEEFLEIMALVGMACKPLHVRRLQKSLQEWVTRPGVFRSSNSSFQYLPPQSVSLSSVGIDVQDILMPPQTNTPATPRSKNGNANVFKLDDNSTRRHGGNSRRNSRSDDKELQDEAYIAFLMDSQVRKYSSSIQSLSTKGDLLAKLHADRSLKEINSALSSGDTNKLELVVADYVKRNITFDNHATARHKALVRDVAVKLCLAEHGLLLKKSELSAAAEKIASDIESKVSRRSSMHLHGSTGQAQELNQALQNIQNHQLSLEKRLEDECSNKNIPYDNGCQDGTERLSAQQLPSGEDENESRQKTSATAAAEAFSSDLAELAKAHNLTLGNLQSLETYTQNQVENLHRDASTKCSSPESPTEASRGDRGSVGVRSGKRKFPSHSSGVDGSKKLITAAEV